MKSKMQDKILFPDKSDNGFNVIVFGKKFAFVLLLCAIGFFACKKNDPKEVEELTKKTVQKEQATGVEMIYSDSAKVKAKLSAPVLIRILSDSPVVEFPNNVEVLFYDVNLEVNSKLRANYGIRYVNKNITIVRGDVVVVNVKGDTMNTEEMTWHEATDKVTSNKFVKVKTKDEIILAEGFESDVNFTKYTFYKIKGTIAVEQE